MENGGRRGDIQVETGPTDEDVKTADVKRDDNPKLEETVGQGPITVPWGYCNEFETAPPVEDKKDEKEKKVEKTPEAEQKEMTARTWNTNLEVR